MKVLAQPPAVILVRAADEQTGRGPKVIDLLERYLTVEEILGLPTIAFIAYACVRHLARRVALQKRPLSPRVIREALNDRQYSVLHDPENGKRHIIPSRPSAEAKAIYATLGLNISDRPYEMTAGDTETTADQN